MTERLVEAKHFKHPDNNKRFTAWLRVTGKQVGDTYTIREYITWVNARLTYFKRQNGLGDIEPLTKLPNGHKRFDAYLESLEVK